MVSVQAITLSGIDRKEAKVSLFADSKSEVTDDMEIIGMPKDVKIIQGSSVITADADVAFYKSDGTWNWV